MTDCCEYCRIPITPESRCRYQQHSMASCCTEKYDWLRQRAYLEPELGTPIAEVSGRYQAE